MWLLLWPVSVLLACKYRSMLLHLSSGIKLRHFCYFSLLCGFLNIDGTVITATDPYH